jgi:16S rRNA (cytidine1402-2'-O)-methyltransferase
VISIVAALTVAQLDTTGKMHLVGTLYIVATPIGNLDDMSPRAVATLQAVRVIAAEDTRHSAKLLRRFEIATPMLSYHQHNEREREERLLAALADGDVALISDAGTPAISDPGQKLVAAALARGHRVVPIPGPSALTAAVSASGMVPGPFVFLGFVPRGGEERRRALTRAATSGFPVVLFESPVRLGGTLSHLAAAFGDRPALIARELTKLHEELSFGTLDTLADAYRETEPRGEVVIVVGEAVSSSPDGGDVEAVVRRLLADGLKPSRAAREAAAITGRPGAELYELVRAVAGERRGER